MTTSKTFNKCAIALTISTLFATASSMANPAQPIGPSVADTTAKLQNQSGFETQFIIKYKNNNVDALSYSTADESPVNMKARAKNFVKNFASKKGKVKAKYIRAMALNNHHVMRADKKLSAAEAQEFMSNQKDSHGTLIIKKVKD